MSFFSQQSNFFARFRYLNVGSENSNTRQVKKSGVYVILRQIMLTYDRSRLLTQRGVVYFFLRRCWSKIDLIPKDHIHLLKVEVCV